MLEDLLRNGVEPVADVVINHRDGSTGWADFYNPEWGPWAICETDEAFQNPASGIAGTPIAERGRCEERPVEYTRHRGTTYQYESFRDLADTDRRVRQDVVRYVRQLKSAGYRGWRYDMVHGFHARWIALYNRLTTPTFSVGEYDWTAHNEQRGWIWNTATDATAAGERDPGEATFLAFLSFFLCPWASSEPHRSLRGRMRVPLTSRTISNQLLLASSTVALNVPFLVARPPPSPFLRIFRIGLQVLPLLDTHEVPDVVGELFGLGLKLRPHDGLSLPDLNAADCPGNACRTSSEPSRNIGTTGSPRPMLLSSLIRVSRIGA